MKTKKTKKVKEPKEVKPAYKATVKVMGKTYEASGDSALSAISSLKPGNCKGKAILTVTKGDVSKERILMPPVVSRLFNMMGSSKEIAVKQISTLFQGI